MYSKLVTKRDIGWRGYMQIVISSLKKLCISFYFLLVFGQSAAVKGSLVKSFHLLLYYIKQIVCC